MTVGISRFDATASYPHLKSFDCGNATVNDFARRSLKQSVQRAVCVGYVLSDDENSFVGFCTVMAFGIDRSALTALKPPSLPAIVPVTKVGMFGVDVRYSRRGLGRDLLVHAIERMVEASESVGSYGLYLDADDAAYNFYLKCGLIPLRERQVPTTPMFLPTLTVRQAMHLAASR